MSQMCKGIDKSQLMVAFITENYIQKVGGQNSNDNCQLEFNYGLLQKSPAFMIAVVMEPRVKNPKSWRGPVGMALGGSLYIDMSSDADIDSKVDLLFNTIVQMIRPRYLSSHFSSLTASMPSSTAVAVATSPSVTRSLASSPTSSGALTKPLRDLSIEEVSKLLESCKLTSFKDAFTANEIDGETLACVKSETEMVELGITLLPKARLFFEKIKTFEINGVPTELLGGCSSPAATPPPRISPRVVSARQADVGPFSMREHARTVMEGFIGGSNSVTQLVMQSLSRIDENISNKSNHAIASELGLVPVLGDIVRTVTEARWITAHILAVMSINDDIKGTMECLGGNVKPANEAWRCGGTTNNALIRNLVQAKIVKSVIVAATMFSLDRGNYAPRDPYADSPQRIGYGAKKDITTISAPHMHAHALQELCGTVSVRDCKVLDVGCGSGYLTAAFARLNPMAKVIGIDHIVEMVQLSEANMMKSDQDLLESHRVKLILQDAWEGCVSEMPFDLIHVGAAAATIPQNLLKQMKVGGKMFIPVGPDGGSQKLLFIERKGEGNNFDEDYTSKEILGVRYVPLVNVKNLP